MFAALLAVVVGTVVCLPQAPQEPHHPKIASGNLLLRGGRIHTGTNADWPGALSVEAGRIRLGDTLDPAFDTPAVLKQFAKARNLDKQTFTLATGNEVTLSDFAGEFNVMGFKSEGSISHNLKTVLLDANLVEIKQFKENEWTAADVISAFSAQPKL